MRKINPRRKPLSQADYRQAKKKAEDTALNIALAIILTALFDGGFLTPEQMRPAWEYVNYKADSVARGYVKAEDMIQSLADEYDIYIGKSLA